MISTDSPELKGSHPSTRAAGFTVVGREGEAPGLVVAVLGLLAARCMGKGGQQRSEEAGETTDELAVKGLL